MTRFYPQCPKSLLPWMVISCKLEFDKSCTAVSPSSLVLRPVHFTQKNTCSEMATMFRGDLVQCEVFLSVFKVLQVKAYFVSTNLPVDTSVLWQVQFSFYYFVFLLGTMQSPCNRRVVNVQQCIFNLEFIGQIERPRVVASTLCDLRQETGTRLEQ